MDPTGKVAIVTGGASGLGFACVEALSAAGAKVAVLDLKPVALEGVLSVESDITNDASAQSAVDRVVEAFGRVDICLNCAGIGGIGAIATPDGPADMDAFRRVIDVNLLGAVNVTRLVAHRMIHNEKSGPDDERGVIVNTVSIASFEGQEGMGPYTASKAALAALTLVWARDLSRHNIRCMAIAPGFFETPLTADIPAPLVEQLLSTSEYPRRAGHPREFADLAMFVVRSAMLNGEVIRIDGGTRPPARTRWTQAS